MQGLQIKLIIPFLFFVTSLTYGQSGSNVLHAPMDDRFVVVLDAGHGGKDSGAQGNGYMEKNIALATVLKLGKNLEKHQDIKVIYTRKSDVFVELKDRAEKANRADADLFVSVHLNSMGNNSGPHGTETYVLGTSRNKDNLDVAMRENSVIYLEEDYKKTYNGFDPESPSSYVGMTLMQEEYLDQSILLADFVQKQYKNTLHRTDRGVKNNIFLVLRETYMPSILTEIGFITNRLESRYLKSAKGQQKIANSLTQGILSYKDHLNLNAAAMLDKKEDVTFRVQVAAGSKALEPSPSNFKGLDDIDREKEDGLYKYYYGETPDYKRIKKLYKNAKKSGYENAYIVVFKNGEKMDVNDFLDRHKE